MKLKKWLLTLAAFAVMAVVCAVAAGAENYSYGDFSYTVLDDGTVAITKYIGSAEKVDISEKIDGKSVTGIGNWAFNGCTNLTSITIPDSVTSIGGYAFSGCTSLTNVQISNGVTFIGLHAFYDCTSLKTVTIPASVTNIGDYAIGYYEDKSNSIAWSTKKIAGFEIKYTKNTYGHWYATKNGFADESCSITNELDDGTLAIKYAGHDETYVIPAEIDGKRVTKIDNAAFSDCKNLESITIPDSVTSIGWSAFSGCRGLKSVAIPKSVIEIGSYAFEDCSSLTSIIIPDGMTSISEHAFDGCESLTSVKIPDNVTSIGDLSFYRCTSLENVTIPNKVKTIGICAFGDCTSLTNITIPKSVTSIESDAFGYYYCYTNLCEKLDNFKIYCYPGTAGEQYAKDNGFDYELVTIEKSANVTGFKVKSISSTNVTLQWTKNSAASGYEIEQYKSGKWVNVAKIISNATTSYTVKGLAAGTAGYKFRMRAVKDGVYSDYTSTLTVNTNPYGVGGFKCSSKSSTSVTLKWNKGTTASGYQLQQYKDGKWVTIYTGTKATDTSYTVKNLKAGTAGYRFRIRAYKTYGSTKQYGSWSSEVKVNTNPYGVGGFKCSSKSSTSVTLKWNKGTTASGYQLQQYKNGKWVTIYTGTKATDTSYTVKNLKAGTAGYRFRIRAYKTYGSTKQYGSWSSEVKVNTNPYGVGGFKTKSISSTSVTLQWNKGTTASGYQLQQYKNGKWVTIYTGTKATSTSYTVKSLKANTSYKFRIRAYKTYGSTKQYGSWSSTLTVKTKK